MGKVPHPMSCGSWNIKSFCQKGEISGKEGEYLPDGNVVLEFSRTVQETQGPFSPSSTSADTRSPCYLLIRARYFFLEKLGLILGALDWYRLSLRVHTTFNQLVLEQGQCESGLDFLLVFWIFSFDTKGKNSYYLISVFPQATCLLNMQFNQSDKSGASENEPINWTPCIFSQFHLGEFRLLGYFPF